VSYNVPPYGRAGLYLELANLKEMVEEFRSDSGENVELCQTIFGLAQRSGMLKDVPLQFETVNELDKLSDSDLPRSVIADGRFKEWILHLSDYLNILQDRLFSSGLR
jgi:magnesium chelatase subunit H